MKTTNNLGINPFIVSVVEKLSGEYDRGECDFTITELTKLPQQRVLFQKHKDKLVRDISDNGDTFIGHCVHKILADNANPGDIIEKRFFGNFGGFVVSSQIDRLDTITETLYDWKTTKAWAFKLGRKPKDEWCFQLNGAREILRQNEVLVSSLKIGGFLKDYSKSEASEEVTYPKAFYQEMDIPLWSKTKTYDEIMERIEIHEAAMKDCPPCDKKDLWKNGDRCRFWCDVNSVCPQYNNKEKKSV